MLSVSSMTKLGASYYSVYVLYKWLFICYKHVHMYIIQIIIELQDLFSEVGVKKQVTGVLVRLGRVKNFCVKESWIKPQKTELVSCSKQGIHTCSKLHLIS